MCGALAMGQAAPKKRIAIFDFENAASTGQMTPMFYSSSAPNTGKAVANQLISRLVQIGTVSILERAQLDKLLAEQNLTNSDRTDPLTAAKLGRILGVDAIVMGAITQNDVEDKVTGGGGSRFGGFGGVSMSTKHDYKVKVKIIARVVSPDTAEVLSVSEGAGEVIKKGVKVDMRDTRAMLGGDTGTGPIVSEAVDKAVAQLTTGLEAIFPKLPARARVLEGLIADVNESGRLVLNLGTNVGATAGEKLQVWRKGKEIRDPGTGKVLLRDDILLGEATITSVQEAASFASFQGAELPKTGDIVKTAPKK